jgi:hypothetical protein
MCAVAVGVYRWAGGEHSAAAVVPPSTPVVVAQAQPLAPVRQEPRQQPASVEPDESHETPPARPDEFPVYDESQPAETYATAASQTTDEDPVNQRATAIREAAQAGGAGQLALLTQTLSTDTLARNRMLAINSLRMLAVDPALAPQVLDALRDAQGDRDANVARHARDAYQELANR